MGPKSARKKKQPPSSKSFAVQGSSKQDAAVSVHSSERSYNRGSVASLGSDSIVTYDHLLMNIVFSETAAMTWLMERGYLPDSRECHVCQELMKLEEVDGRYVWQCVKQSRDNPHLANVDVTHGTWFSRTELTLTQTLKMLYLWCGGFTVAQLQLETILPSQTLWDCIDVFRQICLEHINRDIAPEQRIGGLGIEIELAESKFTKQCLLTSAKTDLGWVLRGKVKNAYGQHFMEILTEHDPGAIRDLIIKHIAAKSVIFCVSWNPFERLGQDICYDLMASHGLNFKEASDFGLSGIENDWQRVQKSIDFQRMDPHETNLVGFFAEHLWRIINDGKDVFEKFLGCGKEVTDEMSEDEKCLSCHCIVTLDLTVGEIKDESLDETKEERSDVVIDDGEFEMTNYSLDEIKVRLGDEMDNGNDLSHFQD